MEEEDKKEGEKSESSVVKDKSDAGDKTSEIKEPSEQDAMEIPSPKHDGSSEASQEVFGGESDPSKVAESALQDETEYDDEMVLRRLRCLTSSFLAGVRSSLHCKI